MYFKIKQALAGISIFSGLLLSAEVSSIDPQLKAKITPLSAQDSLKTFEVAPGYEIQLVASEPMVNEPVLCVWDGNGRMYVAEMNTYMQDADATGENEAKSRVLLLEDTDGDGKMDKRTVFADNLVLPRMILPLDNRIIIGETNTKDKHIYTDTDGDGVADKKELWLKGGKQGGNMEHQPSGLVWNADNWIYTTKDSRRFRFTRGKVEIEKCTPTRSQWGLSYDDRGRMYTGFSGAERAFEGFQQPWRYGYFDLPEQYEKDFLTVWPIDDIPDTQGGKRRLRDNNTLNHFTAGCGHSIYRDSLIPELNDNLFICEPVGRLVRRGVVSMENGKRVISHPHGQKEFLRSSDPNFRPVNSAMGPDGALYIVDMYRGIIQQGRWTPKGSYLRGVIDKYGLAENIGRGRIYRVVKKGSDLHSEKPNMLNETTSELVGHLKHSNGWWRDTAKKIIILRNDKSVVPELHNLVEDKSLHAYARMAALWTLEGLDALKSEFVLSHVNDQDLDLSIAAVQAGESFLKNGNSEIFKKYYDLAMNHSSEEMKIQAYLSINSYYQGTDKDTVLETLLATAPEDSPRAYFGKAYFDRKKAEAAEAARLAEIARKNEELAAAITRGKKNYQTMCISCHGAEGKGTPMAGTNTKLGAPLSGSERVTGKKERLIRIALQGLIGPIEGKIYPGVMQGMAMQDDKWLADTLTYIRNDWGQKAHLIKPEHVAKIREETASRKAPWTIKELEPWAVNYFEDRHDWKLTSDRNSKDLFQAIDGKESSRWSTGGSQKPGMWLQIELPGSTLVAGLELNSEKSKGDIPKKAQVEVSLDGKNWQTVLENVSSLNPKGEFIFKNPVKAKFFKVTLQAKKHLYWSIHELNLIPVN